MRLIAIICAAAIALSGCGATEQTQPTTGAAGTAAVPPASVTASPANAPAITEVPTMSTPAGTPADQVIAMHAQAFNVDPATISVISNEEVEWSSSALGCPKPDMMYMTVITPGFRIVIEQGGTQYSYHAGRAGNFFLCESPEK